MMFANTYQNMYATSQPGQAPTAPASMGLGSLDDLMAGNSAPAFFTKGSKQGDTVSGVVEKIEVTQMRDFQTQQPAYWNDGKPKEQIHIIIQTSLRDPAVDDDDGRRSLWVKGWGLQLKALREACRQAGVKSPRVGDTVAERFTGYRQEGNAPQPSKVYEFKVTAKDQASDLISGAAASPAAMPAPAVRQTPQAQPVQAMPPVAPTPQQVQQVRQLAAAGNSMQRVGELTGLAYQQVVEILQPQQGGDEQPEF
ncbi:MAG: hypothetical protein ACRC44_08760 [Bifidobacterium asteroides]